MITFINITTFLHLQPLTRLLGCSYFTISQCLQFLAWDLPSFAKVSAFSKRGLFFLSASYHANVYVFNECSDWRWQTLTGIFECFFLRFSRPCKKNLAIVIWYLKLTLPSAVVISLCSSSSFCAFTFACFHLRISASMRSFCASRSLAISLSMVDYFHKGNVRWGINEPTMVECCSICLLVLHSFVRLSFASAIIAFLILYESWNLSCQLFSATHLFFCQHPKSFYLQTKIKYVLRNHCVSRLW